MRVVKVKMASGADTGSNGRMGPTLTYADDPQRVKSRRVLHSSTKVEVD